MRVVIAEDSVLLREGLARVLADEGFELVAQAGDASELRLAVGRHRPDVAIVDVRMPPTHTDEGARAALELRARHPSVGVLVLSQVVEAKYALALFSEQPEGFGHLLKDRVLDVPRGRPARRAPRHRRRPAGRRAAVRPPTGARPARRADAPRAGGTPKTVEPHVSGIFGKLGLAPAPDDHRRVLAVLTFVGA